MLRYNISHNKTLNFHEKKELSRQLVLNPLYPTSLDAPIFNVEDKISLRYGKLPTKYAKTDLDLPLDRIKI